MTLLEVPGVLYTDSNGLILFFLLWGDVTLHSSLEELFNLPVPISMSGGETSEETKTAYSHLAFLKSFFLWNFLTYLDTLNGK